MPLSLLSTMVSHSTFVAKLRLYELHGWTRNQVKNCLDV